MTQDIGTAKLRFRDYPIDKMVYVVGNEQNYHFQVLSLLLDRLGFEWGKSLVHFSYGMVELPNGKMKSREGTVVDADDLIEGMIEQARRTMDEAGKNGDMSEAEKQEVARIVGLGALKYFLLKVDARKNMVFNPEESIDFNGNTGPFIQYTYARIRSILRKAQEAGLEMTAVDPATEISVKEEEIIQRIADFTAVVRAAGQDYSPSAIANYCYELVKDYNQFYHEFQILREEDAAKRNFRLVLSRNVAKSGASRHGTPRHRNARAHVNRRVACIATANHAQGRFCRTPVPAKSPFFFCSAAFRRSVPHLSVLSPVHE